MLLTGGLCAGKTAVAQEIAAASVELGLDVAAIDVDWLGWASSSSATVDELITRNLQAVAANYAAAGISRLVLARAVVSPAALQTITEALPGWELMVVRLNARRETQERRLRSRDSGDELTTHLGKIDDMNRRVETATPDAPVVENDDRAIRDVALEVMRVSGWTSER